MKISWTRDQRAKAKKFGLPLIAIAIDGQHLPQGAKDFAGGMKVAGPATSSALAKKVTDLIVEFCKEADKAERAAEKGKVANR